MATPGWRICLWDWAGDWVEENQVYYTWKWVNPKKSVVSQKTFDKGLNKDRAESFDVQGGFRLQSMEKVLATPTQAK